MSTIAGKGSEDDNPNVRRYRGCGYDGNDYDEDDCCFYGEGSISRSYGYYKDGIWYPPGRIATPPAPEITYTEEELKELKRCYRSEKAIVKLLSERSEETLRFFRYVDYINQEFKKLQKRYDDTQEEVDRLRRIASYYIFVNSKEYYLLEYSTWENGHSVYVTKRVGLKRGDIITGYNCNTQAHFSFNGGMILGDGLSKEDFEKLPRGLMCKTDGIYDIEIILEYGKDIVRVKPTTSEYNKFELAKQDYKNASKNLLVFMKSIEKLHEKVSNIIDRGSKIDPENLGEALKRWQCLDRIVEYDIYQPYEKKVAKYGTSY